MLTYETKKKLPAIIKVIGVGGAGMNAVERMVSQNITGVEIIAMNTDEQVLTKSSSPHKLLLGSRHTRGLGAGARPEVGEEAAIEDKEQIHSMLSGADMVFITSGLGGGTGTGASPIVAEIAKEIGALTVGVVSMPFTFEGARKSAIANEGLERLRKHVDTLIVMPNDFIFRVIDKNTSVNLAFKAIDDVLAQSVIGISQIINSTGYINVDFADVRTVMENNGDALIGIGQGEGEDRVLQALNSAIHHPLLEGRHIDGASFILINIVVGEDFTMQEYSDIQKTIYDLVSEDAQMIVGFTNDTLLDNSAYITVIATGFGESQIMSERIMSERTLSDLSKQTIENTKKLSNLSLDPKSNLSTSNVSPYMNSSTHNSSEYQKYATNKNYEHQTSPFGRTENVSPITNANLVKKSVLDIDMKNNYQKNVLDIDMKNNYQKSDLKFPSINHDMDELEIPTFLRKARKNKI